MCGKRVRVCEALYEGDSRVKVAWILFLVQGWVGGVHRFIEMVLQVESIISCYCC